MGFSRCSEPRVGLFHSLADGVWLSRFSTITCPQSRISLEVMRNGFSTVGSQILEWVQTDLCCSWAHPNRKEEET